MQIYKKRDLCSGCSNCANKCPQKCIKMVPDEKGFLYPKVDENKCVNCLMCQKVCPTYSEELKRETPKLFAYTSDNTDVLENCSSGGAFGMIADMVLSDNGYVCGAVWTPDFKVKHTVTDSPEIVKKMYGSKYLQSDLGDCFKIIEKLLKEDKKVLFSGTPCQALALCKFLNKPYENLLIVDFICHSIPSPKVFEEYIKLLEKENGKLTGFSFRNKNNGWENYALKAEFDNEVKLYPHKGNDYMELFLDEIIHRDCCNYCTIKTTTGYASDITLADFWKVKDINPHVYNRNGVSAVLINTEKGSKILQNADLIECEAEPFLKVNKAYNTTVNESPKTETFWNMFYKKGLEKTVKQIYKKSLIIRLKTTVKNILDSFK